MKKIKIKSIVSSIIREGSDVSQHDNNNWDNDKIAMLTRVLSSI